ncbi:WD40 repeat-like protein, partial [Trametes sanguinea]
HFQGIASVAFSPEGTFLATAGLDARVCVWRVEDAVLLYSYHGDSPVLSIVWIRKEESMVCGMANGYVAILSIGQGTIEAHGFLAHRYPVECLAYGNGFLATGAHSELKVWRLSESARQHALEVELSGLPSTYHTTDHEILVTSLHWSSSETGDRLMVTYMHHGMSIFNTGAWTIARTLTFRGLIASASVSHDSEYIVISNLHTGFDVYRLSSKELIKTFTHEVGRPHPAPVTFIHHSRAVLGGSTTGHVNIWDLRLGKLHSL